MALASQWNNKNYTVLSFYRMKPIPDTTKRDLYSALIGTHKTFALGHSSSSSFLDHDSKPDHHRELPNSFQIELEDRAVFQSFT